MGVVFGVLIGLASDSYLKILNKDNKILYSIINGTFSTGSFFGKKLMQMLVPLIIIFLLNLNYYLGFLSYLIVAYQGGLLTLTIFAIVSLYKVSGILNVLFIIIPINLLYIAVIIFFASCCKDRSKDAFLNKSFSFGFKNKGFVCQMILSVALVFVIVFFSVVVLPIILKSAIFIIF